MSEQHSAVPDGAPAVRPLPLPVRILVKGASTVGWMSGQNPRSALAFPRAAQAALAAQGRPAEVHTHTIPSERTVKTLDAWQREAIGFSPDVVVLVFGHYETIHLVLPWALERHANSLKARPRRLRELYRRRLLRPLWMSLASLQARLDHVARFVPRRRRLERVGADLQRLIGHLRGLNEPLVLVFELLPPAPRYVSWFPGMDQRIAIMNDVLRRTVAAAGSPDVRFLEVSKVLADLGGDVATECPDGFHYSARLHRAVGEELARVVAEWADGQPHLALPQG